MHSSDSGEPQRRTTRAISAPLILSAFSRVCPKSVGSDHEIRRFSGRIYEGDGLKNRRLGQCKMWIRQVLISRTLTDCGEVAERLKAAVCYTEIRLSGHPQFPPKSFTLFHFYDRASWLVLALEVPFWELAGTISGTVLSLQPCPVMSNIDNIRYGV